MSEPRVPDPTDPKPDDAAEAPADAELPPGDAAAGDINPDAVERLSLGARLRQTKTIVSILVPLAIGVRRVSRAEVRSS